MKYFFRKLYKQITYRSRIQAASVKWIHGPWKRLLDDPVARNEQMPRSILRNASHLFRFEKLIAPKWMKNYYKAHENDVRTCLL
jgi:hypothetical protein